MPDSDGSADHDQSTAPSGEWTDCESETPNDKPREYGGPKGPEPTRFGDWERKGRCVDF